MHYNKCILRKIAKYLPVHLTPLMRAGMLKPWSDKEIKTGDNWRDEIRKALESADVIVALITADFLASDFIMDVELRSVLEKADKGRIQKQFVPVVIKPSVIGLLPKLEQFQSSNSLQEPIAAMSDVDQEAAFVKVVKDIIDALGNRLQRELSNEAPGDGETALSKMVGLSTEDVEFLIKHPLGHWETVHLRKLAAVTPFRYVPRGNFYKELTNLLDHQMIERQPGRGRRSALKSGGENSDLRKHFKITEQGTRYLKLIEQLGLQRAQA